MTDCLSVSCSKRFLKSDVRYDDITSSDIVRLQMMLEKEIARAGLDLRISSVDATLNRDGSITSAKICVSNDFLVHVGAVEFEVDGVVSVASRFTDEAETRIAMAFLSWLVYMELRVSKERSRRRLGGS